MFFCSASDKLQVTQRRRFFLCVCPEPAVFSFPPPRMPLRYSELECRNTQVVDDANYTGLEVCKDPAGQL